MTTPPGRDGSRGGAGSTRPELLVVLAGTGTDVGKTWVGCRLVRELRATGWEVAARKPVQSFDPSEAGLPTDADLLAEASGEEPVVVCPTHRRYGVAMAPPMAADALGRPAIALAELLDELAASWPGSSVGPPPPPTAGVVELAGGVRSPVAHDGDGVDLIEGLRPDLLIVVADAGLGTLNAVRTTLDSLAALDTPVAVHLNRFDPDDDLHRRNRAWLEARSTELPHATVVTTSPDELAAQVLSIDGRRLRGGAT